MERSYSYDENLDDFSNPLGEIYKKGIEGKKSDTDNDTKQCVYCDENSIDQIHFNKKHRDDFYLDQTLDFHDNHKHNGGKSKSREKAKASRLNFNSSGNSQILKSNTINFSKDKDFYYNRTNIIGEEDLNEFNENFDKEYPQSIKIPDSNVFEKEIKNINLEFEFDIDKDQIQKERSYPLNQNFKNETDNKMRNDFILNFDPNDKNNNFTMKRTQTVQIIKEGILQKKSPWFHYNTRKIVLDSTPRIDYIDPVLNKVKGSIYLTKLCAARFKKHNVFELKTVKRTFKFKTDDFEAGIWCRVINECIEKYSRD